MNCSKKSFKFYCIAQLDCDCIKYMSLLLILLISLFLGGIFIIYLTLLLLILLKLLVNILIILILLLFFLKITHLVNKMMHGLKEMTHRIGAFFTLKNILRVVIISSIGLLFKLFIYEIFHIDVFKDWTSLISIAYYLLIGFINLIITVLFNDFLFSKDKENMVSIIKDDSLSKVKKK